MSQIPNPKAGFMIKFNRNNYFNHVNFITKTTVSDYRYCLISMSLLTVIVL